MLPAYHSDLQEGQLDVSVSSSPQARVHRSEWSKVLNGEPVEINPRCARASGGLG